MESGESGMRHGHSDAFGIDMRQFCRRHEALVQRRLEEQSADRGLLEMHLEKLRWLQHERLVHLLVLFMTVCGELFMAFLTFAHPETNPLAAGGMLILAVLLGFYFVHYFFLENTTQHWYHLAEELAQVAGSWPEADEEHRDHGVGSPFESR